MIREEIVVLTTQYFNSIPEIKGQQPPMMLIDFAIEKFCQHRNYPASYDEESIEYDLRDHKSTIAMAVVDLFMKIGAEGEKSHSDSGVQRTYENAYISLSLFRDVLSFVSTPGSKRKRR